MVVFCRASSGWRPGPLCFKLTSLSMAPTSRSIIVVASLPPPQLLTKYGRHVREKSPSQSTILQTVEGILTPGLWKSLKSLTLSSVHLCFVVLPRLDDLSVALPCQETQVNVSRDRSSSNSACHQSVSRMLLEGDQNRQTDAFCRHLFSPVWLEEVRGRTEA